MLTSTVPEWLFVVAILAQGILNAYLAVSALARQHARHLADIKRIGEIAGEMTTKLAVENTELREQIKELHATVNREWEF